MKKHLTATASAAALCLAAQPALAAFQLEVTEIWPGNVNAPNATEDWFEVTNTGDQPWLNGAGGLNLYFFDNNTPTSAVLLSGVASIAPGESVVFVDNGAAGVTQFQSFWGPVVSPLPQIGNHQGPGLSGAGDSVRLWLSNGTPLGGAVPIAVATFPNTAGFPAASYDVDLGVFSTVGNAAGAVSRDSVPPTPDSTTASPGVGPAVATIPGGPNLAISEIWPGNAVNPNVTNDWFEVINRGDTAWVAATNGNLYVDDNEPPPNQSVPANSVLASGITTIAPGERVIFVETAGANGVSQFQAFWAANYGGQVGTYTGSGVSLGGAGDGIALYQSFSQPISGDAPIASATFPTTVNDPGESYDVITGAFSTTGVNGAVTIPRGPAPPPEPTIASPGGIAGEPAPVPLPGWLVAPALTALAALLRRRRAA